MHFLLAAALAMSTAPGATEPAVAAPAVERLTLGGGCFWCVEAVYEELRGVNAAVSGYAGGQVDHPTYKQVTSGLTGHAEVVQISFDPKVISRDTLLKVFFTVHDPTTLNRQGADVGTQYRSVAFFETPEQKAAIEKAIAEVNAEGAWGKAAVTEVAPLEKFWPAEDYHQQYYELNGEAPYCSYVIAPKIKKFRKQFAELLK